MNTQQPSPFDADSRQKTTLFCPNCGHESDITGDWDVRTVEARLVTDCPDCEMTITNRPRGRSLIAPSD